MKIELFETSAVGTPAYPYAQFNNFMRSLSKAYNIERRVEKEMTEKEVAVEEVKEAVSEVKAVESVEAKAVEVAQVTEKAVVAEEKDAKMEDLVQKLSDAISKLSVDRGLVEKKASAVADVKSASAGELFLAMLKR